MLLLAEQQLDDPPATSSALPTTATTTSSKNELELVHRTAWRAALIAGFNVAALILATRLILLLAVLGALGLTWIAAQGGTPMQLGAVGLYTCTVILPLVWLSSRR